MVRVPIRTADLNSIDWWVWNWWESHVVLCPSQSELISIEHIKMILDQYIKHCSLITRWGTQWKNAVYSFLKRQTWKIYVAFNARLLHMSLGDTVNQMYDLISSIIKHQTPWLTEGWEAYQLRRHKLKYISFKKETALVLHIKLSLLVMGSTAQLVNSICRGENNPISVI